SLAIDNRSVILQGWGDGVTCAAIQQCLPFCSGPDSTVPLVDLDGLNASSRVLTITGNSAVTLRNIRILRGDAGSGAGGGILFYGTGSLTLAWSDVLLSHAPYGGGIEMNGNGGTALLQLYPYSQILNNTAEV